jgi:predicted acetyltransferase
MSDRPSEWTLDPVSPGERRLLERLLQLYLYDFSEIDPDDVDEEGVFSYTALERYGRDPGYHALLLRVGGRPAGFALIDETSPLENGAGKHYITEFHVLRGYRGEGYGRLMAWSIFDRFPGVWQIEQIGPNVDAQAFWRRVIHGYTGGRYREYTYQGKRFTLYVQEFDTRDRDAP